MNKMQTLIRCRNLWAYLAITGSDCKEDYRPARRWAFACPCCMYAGAIRKNSRDDDYNRECRKCLLLGYAWNLYNNTLSSRVACINDYSQSFYYEWMNSYTRSERSYWAMRMVRACDKAIEDLIVGKLK